MSEHDETEGQAPLTRRERRVLRKERRARARERREILLLLDTADEPNRRSRMFDALSRTPPVLILLIGLFGDLVGTTALGVAYALQHQQTRRIEANRAEDHEIFCDFFGDLGAIRIRIPAGVSVPASVKAFDKLISDGARVHERLKGCGPLPPSTLIIPSSTSSPSPPPPPGR